MKTYPAGEISAVAQGFNTLEIKDDFIAHMHGVESSEDQGRMIGNVLKQCGLAMSEIAEALGHESNSSGYQLFRRFIAGVNKRPYDREKLGEIFDALVKVMKKKGTEQSILANIRWPGYRTQRAHVKGARAKGQTPK